MMLRFSCNVDLGEDGLWSGSIYLRVGDAEHAGTLDGASDADLERALRQASEYIEGIWPDEPPAEIKRLLTLLDED